MRSKAKNTQACQRWRERHPERVRREFADARRHVTGMLPLVMVDWFVNEPCPICNKPMKKPCRDHNHETNTYRGVICDRCNLMLGKADDRIDILQNAIAYLVRTNS